MDSAAGRPEGALRLAVQKDGRLTQDTLALLHGCGLEFDSYRNQLFAPCRNFPLAILYGRDDDIPSYVASGTVDAGIVGRNLLIERRVTDRVRELAPLGFAPCRLVIAVPKEAHITKPEDLRDQRIATTFPHIVGEYFKRLRVSVEIVEIAGAVAGTHRHRGGDEDVILEAGQVGYWAMVAAIALEHSYDAWRPHALWLAGWSDSYVALPPRDGGLLFDCAGLILAAGDQCREAGVHPARVVAADLAAMRATYPNSCANSGLSQ